MQKSEWSPLNGPQSATEEIAFPSEACESGCIYVKACGPFLVPCRLQSTESTMSYRPLFMRKCPFSHTAVPTCPRLGVLKIELIND